jgi:hypothetical protein
LTDAGPVPRPPTPVVSGERQQRPKRQRWPLPASSRVAASCVSKHYLSRRAPCELAELHRTYGMISRLGGDTEPASFGQETAQLNRFSSVLATLRTRSNTVNEPSNSVRQWPVRTKLAHTDSASPRRRNVRQQPVYRGRRKLPSGRPGVRRARISTSAQRRFHMTLGGLLHDSHHDCANRRESCLGLRDR